MTFLKVGENLARNSWALSLRGVYPHFASALRIEHVKWLAQKPHDAARKRSHRIFFSKACGS